ncbi:lipoprotein-releasing ABC transporter permease subunit [Acidiphilium sp.]|uniref:lipoprotein-releasing ABC transporter permease subunit n=1 Tax=Acidiphilium sp. TaxID=527 RepID=UPI00258875B9|nr:lipoprotein-releasing ABC transporter permease subunit [Acidiphilium sp.]
MFSAFERRVAFRYLRARKGERFVSIIAIFSLVGIALGVATLIIVMSVMNGFRQELLAQILGLNGDIGVYGAGHNITQYDAAAGRLAKIPGVISAIPIVQGEVLMTGPHGGAIGGVARGIQPDGLAKLRTVSRHIVAGSLKDFTGRNIAVGAGVASQLGISLGGTITLVLPQGDATIIGTIPRIQSFHVSAIFRTGMAQYDSSFVFLPLTSAQTLFRAKDAATQIQLFVKNPDNTGPIKAAIPKVMGSAPVNVVDWQDSNNAFFAAVNVERNVMFLILTLIIVVAVFNVVSSMIMMVKDKTADIAILRTMGATSGSIMRIFFMVGASVGVIGTIAGFGLGVVFCAHIEQIRQFVQGLTGTQLFNPTVYYLESLPAKLVWSQVIEVVVIAIGLSFVATLYPSWRAARTDPVEALRHE